ncbi:hypothetical protein NC651_001412 [Populus alba x Populus x berolinensis]|nr:hypothetical protein NC651_001412 [Populus alba x Populus x berolinensis]
MRLQIVHHCQVLLRSIKGSNYSLSKKDIENTVHEDNGTPLLEQQIREKQGISTFDRLKH